MQRQVKRKRTSWRRITSARMAKWEGGTDSGFLQPRQMVDEERCVLVHVTAFTSH